MDAVGPIPEELWNLTELTNLYEPQLAHVELIVYICNMEKFVLVLGT